MQNAKYDIRRIKAALRLLAEEIRVMKKTMRQPLYQPTGQEWQALRSAKMTATTLCCLRAHHRGKLHLKNETRALELALFLEPQYLLVKTEAA
jgi:hypothetical protein